MKYIILVISFFYLSEHSVNKSPFITFEYTGSTDQYIAPVILYVTDIDSRIKQEYWSAHYLKISESQFNKLCKIIKKQTAGAPPRKFLRVYLTNAV